MTNSKAIPHNNRAKGLRQQQKHTPDSQISCVVNQNKRIGVDDLLVTTAVPRGEDTEKEPLGGLMVGGSVIFSLSFYYNSLIDTLMLNSTSL